MRVLRKLLVVLATLPLIGFSASVSADDILSQSEFVERVIIALEDIGAENITDTEPLTLDYTLPGRELATAFLHNAWRAYRQNPADIDAIISHYIRTTTTADDIGATIDPTAIVPVIRHVDYLRAIKDHADNESSMQNPAHTMLNAELVLLFAEDKADTIRLLREEDVAALDATPEALLAKSLDNLFARLPALERHGEGVMMVTADGHYESSLLLAGFLFTRENFPVDGDFVFAVPSRDVLLVTGSDDREGLKTIAAMARDVARQGPYAISDQLFVRTPAGAIQILGRE